MAKHDLNLIELSDGDQQIRLRRGGTSMGLAAPLANIAAMTSPSAPTVAVAPAAPSPGPAAAVAATATNLIEIKSPTPGTFYSASSPDAEPFARVGTKVKPDTVVCIIEAMKVFNEIPAECTGTIVAINVDNQQSVEYGQVLFKVDPTA
jgi:acetyl-CoA carboxylase biotin carboxyl carrier protein